MPTPSNPLKASPAQLAKLENHAATIAKTRHDSELARRGIRPTIDDIERETAPESWARKQLRARGIEAARLTRNAMIGGQALPAGELVLPIPATPPEGFILEKNLTGLSFGLDYVREGSRITFSDAVRVAGRRYAEGDSVEVFPEGQEIPGFLRPAAFLEALNSGILEPVQLEPATVSQE